MEKPQFFAPTASGPRSDLRDIVVRLSNDAGDFKGGQGTRQAGQRADSARPGKRAVRSTRQYRCQTRNADNSRLIDFSFDFNLNGVKLAPNKKIWFEAEFVGLAKGVNVRAWRYDRSGRAKHIKPEETIVCSALNRLQGSELCDILVSDRQPGQGNLTRVTNVPIQPNKPLPSNLVLTLSNAQAERIDKPGNACKIAVDLKAEGKTRVVFYRCAAVFSIKGVKQQPVEFGKPYLGSELVKGVKVEGPVTIPADADELFEIIVRENLTSNLTVLAELKEVAVTGTVSPGGGQLVAISNVRVFKVDDFTVQVQFKYEFTEAA